MKVYLFEDEEVLLELLTGDLEDLGYQVSPFASIKEFKKKNDLSILKNTILITDNTIPGSTNGIDFVEEVKESLGSDAPFCIVLSGWIVKTEGKLHQPDVILEKPLDLDYLQKILTGLVKW